MRQFDYHNGVLILWLPAGGCQAIISVPDKDSQILYNLRQSAGGRSDPLGGAQRLETAVMRHPIRIREGWSDGRFEGPSSEAD